MSLLKSASKVSVLTLVSRIFGYMRDMVFAMSFGAQAELDIFLLAFKIPNFMRRIFAEGAFSQAFIPVLTQYQASETLGQKEFLSKIFCMLLVSVMTLTIGVWSFPKQILTVFAYGLTKDPDKLALASTLLCYTFPYLGLVTISGFFAAALQTKRQFVHAALAPIALNVVLITTAYYAHIWALQPIVVLSMGVPVAGCIQAWMLWSAYTKHYPNIYLTWDLGDPGIWRVLTLMLAAVYGVSISQIGLIIDNVILSTLAEGSVSWMYFAERVSYLPLGVFGVAMTTVLVPALAHSAQSSNNNAYQTQISWGVKGALLIGLPACVTLMLLAEPVTTTLFHHGRFSWHDVKQTASALRILACGIPAFMLVKVLNSSFYAKQDTWTPVKYATMSLVVNIIVACSTVLWWQHNAIALAIVASAYTNVFLLYYGLHMQGIYRLSTDACWDLGKIQAAVLPAALVYMVDCGNWLEMGTLQKMLTLAGWLLLAGAVYFCALWYSNIKIRSMITQV